MWVRNLVGEGVMGPDPTWYSEMRDRHGQTDGVAEVGLAGCRGPRGRNVKDASRFLSWNF